MSKKKHPEHVNHERWLVSYADFITLLFAFFVVLFASGQADRKKQVQLRHAMEQAFEHNGIFEPHSKTPPIADEAASAEAGPPAPIDVPLRSQQPIDEPHIATAIQQALHDHLAEGLPPDSITLRSSPDGLVVSLREAGFFASGSAELRPEAISLLRRVAAALPHQALRVEGHTDNLPIHTTQFATNWELSTARAATVTRFLIAESVVDPGRIAAAGYAEFHPIADNQGEAGRSRNRRVDIVLLKATSGPSFSK